jgi:hypothetical protein
MNDRTKQTCRELIESCEKLDTLGYKVSSGRHKIEPFTKLAMLRLFVFLGTRGKKLSAEESVFIGEFLADGCVVGFRGFDAVFSQRTAALAVHLFAGAPAAVLPAAPG